MRVRLIINRWAIGGHAKVQDPELDSWLSSGRLHGGSTLYADLDVEEELAREIQKAYKRHSAHLIVSTIPMGVDVKPRELREPAIESGVDNLVFRLQHVLATMEWINPLNNFRRQTMPAHCGNCLYHYWDEDSSYCCYPHVNRDIVIDQMKMMDNPNAVKILNAILDEQGSEWCDYDCVCSEHLPKSKDMPEETIEALCDQTRRRAMRKVEQIIAQIKQCSSEQEEN